MMPTHEEVLKAIDGSIEKWRKIAFEGARDEGPSNCPLCQMFRLKSASIYCESCPVAEFSKATGCHATPYEGWDVHVKFGHYPDEVNFVVCQTCEDWAKDELEFLKKVREWWVKKGEKDG